MDAIEYGPEGLAGEIEGLVVLYGAAKVYEALVAAAKAFGENQELEAAVSRNLRTPEPENVIDDDP